MKLGEIGKQLGSVLIESAMKIDFKPIIYNIWRDTLRPKIEAKVASSEPKWDDALLLAFDKVMDVIFGPESSPAKVPNA